VPDADRLTIRSFRVVFDLERRLHKIDRWRIPVPYGVPLRGIAYGVCALLAIAIASRLPLAGVPLRAIPPPLRLVVLPAGVAYLITRLRVDGRPAHRAVAAMARSLAEPRRVSGFRATEADGTETSLGEVALVPDERSASYRRARIEGPGMVLLRFPARTRARGKTLTVEQTSRRPMVRGTQVTLRPGQRLELR
jgi:hypothetical protein